MAVKVFHLFWHSILPDSIAPEKQDGSNSTAAMFREQINFIVNRYTPISISEFLAIIDNPNVERSFSKPPVVLGFDDGFKGVITHGLPVLKEFNLPAVFFVIGEILKNHEFVPWFVEFKHLVRRTKKSMIRYRNLSINMSSQQDRVQLLHCFQASFRVCRSETSRQKLLQELADALAVDRPVVSDLDDDLRLVTKADLASLDSSSLLTIASHAMTHRHLDCLTYEEQVAELEESDFLLRQYSPCYYPVVSYPSGCFNADTIAIAKKIYKAGFAVFKNSSYRNRYAYQRICITHASVKELAYILNPVRLKCVLPLKQFLDRAGIRKA